MFKINKLHKIIGILLVFGVNACASAPKTDFDPTVDFSKYRSFQWEYASEDSKKINDPVYDSPLFEKKLEMAVAEVLLDRGFNGSDQPDMILKYHLADKERRDNRNFNFSVGYGHYSRYSHWNVFAPHFHEMQRDEVMIIVDALDAGSNELIWRGWTTTRQRTRPLSPEETRSLAIKILAGFPPE